MPLTLAGSQLPKSLPKAVSPEVRTIERKQPFASAGAEQVQPAGAASRTLKEPGGTSSIV
jgi:hypothetical protein